MRCSLAHASPAHSGPKIIMIWRGEIDTNDGDVGAFGREAFGDRSANARRGSRHHDHFAIKLAHACSSVCARTQATGRSKHRQTRAWHIRRIDTPAQ